MFQGYVDILRFLSPRHILYDTRYVERRRRVERSWLHLDIFHLSPVGR